MPSGTEIATTVAVVLGSGSLLGNVWAIVSQRNRPQIELRQAEDATQRTHADIFASNIESLQRIIDEEREAREANRTEYERRQTEEVKAREKLEEDVRKLTIRVERAETVAILNQGLFGIAVGHIQKLENHIAEGHPPPPPPRPAELLGTD